MKLEFWLFNYTASSMFKPNSLAQQAVPSSFNTRESSYFNEYRPASTLKIVLLQRISSSINTKNRLASTNIVQHQHQNSLVSTNIVQHQHQNSLVSTNIVQHQHQNSLVSTNIVQHQHQNSLASTNIILHQYLTSNFLLIITIRFLWISFVYFEFDFVPCFLLCIFKISNLFELLHSFTYNRVLNIACRF